ncbi:MAG: hypothetical protein U0800_05480 [Isosphaeraceae bacterium]
MLECVKTKLIHYYLPALPACALLASWMIHEVAREAVPLARLKLGRLSGALLVGIGLGVTVGLIGLAFTFPATMRAPLLVEAALILAGTLFAVDRFRNRDAMRAAAVMATTWAGVMFLAGAWLVPSAEPYRVSTRVAAKLGEWSSKEEAEPVLANFQVPSVVYAYKQPITVLHTYDELVEILRDGRPVVSALREADLNLFQFYPEIGVEIRETIQGFNIDKGKTETLHVARITHRGQAPSIASAAGQDSRIK